MKEKIEQKIARCSAFYSLKDQLGPYSSKSDFNIDTNQIVLKHVSPGGSVGCYHGDPTYHEVLFKENEIIINNSSSSYNWYYDRKFNFDEVIKIREGKVVSSNFHAIVSVDGVTTITNEPVNDDRLYSILSHIIDVMIKPYEDLVSQRRAQNKASFFNRNESAPIAHANDEKDREPLLENF